MKVLTEKLNELSAAQTTEVRTAIEQELNVVPRIEQFVMSLKP
jgi:hypothetical protein